MPELLDIAPSGDTVKVWGQDMDVPGLSSKGLVYLWRKFPQLQELFNQGKATDPMSLVEVAPEAVAAIIAAGAGAPGCPKTEELAAKMPLDTQLEVLTKIVKVSMPQGLGPFVEKLMGLISGLGDPEDLRTLVDKLPAPSKDS